MPGKDDIVVAAADIDELLRLMADTPVRLNAVSRGLDDDRLQRPPSAGAWSANEILAHLRACADVWGGSITAMIERDHPTLRYVSPRTWIRRTSYTSQRFSESVRAFGEQRGNLVKMLSALEPAAWTRGATFSGTTRGREQTILDYVRRIIAHEQEHLGQIQATVQQV